MLISESIDGIQPLLEIEMGQSANWPVAPKQDSVFTECFQYRKQHGFDVVLIALDLGQDFVTSYRLAFG